MMNQKKKEIFSHQKNVIMSGVAIFIVFFPLTFFSSPVMCADLTIYTEESPNAHFTDKDGKATGYVYELVIEMQKRMGDTTPILIALQAMI
ncbi:MAG: hypothetical protein HQK72_07365 [Desulfamplus sp.]|nr:hypothetical protein [Desulfamplus sp.]